MGQVGVKLEDFRVKKVVLGSNLGISHKIGHFQSFFAIFCNFPLVSASFRHFHDIFAKPLCT